MKNLLLLISLLFSFQIIAQVNPDNITIIRDKWGVPHIYAPTDEEVAYGLAWAAAEDDFKTIQETLLPVKGLLGRVKGPKGAILDFAVDFLEINEAVDARYDRDVSPKFKKITKAYVDAMNAYAAKHPKEVLVKKMFPINERDVIKGYTLALALLSHVQDALGLIISGNINLYENAPMGSNGFAVNSKKTKDGHTYLAINPHQPLEGPYSWYEAHLVSEEGLNVHGATLLGGMHIFVGANENLAWTHTVNHADFADVYKLEMHKTEKNKYFFDGKWETLEERKIKLKAKVIGLKIGIKRKAYRSKHGPVLKSKNGNYYAVRYIANQTIQAAEQWYMMNKARNFDEFKSALSMLGVCTTNLIYADNQDNIFYAGLGLFPKRNPNYNWKKVLPGHTSEVIWKPEFHQFEELAQVHNPASGYVGNSNHTPFNATVPNDNINPSTINPTFGYLTGDNNRSIRYHHLMGEQDKISFEDFRRIKFDTKWHTPAHIYPVPNLELMLNLDPAKYPKVSGVIQLLNQWDRETNVENVGAAVFVLTYHFIGKDIRKRGIYPLEFQLTEPYLIGMLEKTQKHLKKHFKTINVPLGDLQQHVRGDKRIPIWGSPNVIASMHGQPDKKGRFKIFAGESYVSLIRFGEDGVEIESITPYGTSNHSDSPHYTDQMELYSKHGMKKMSLKKEEVMKNVEKSYHPK